MKPILFSAPMVQAILAGQKTMTRRVVVFNKGFNPEWSGYEADGTVIYGSNNIPAAKAKYQPGDILWVRETWTCLIDPETGYKDYFYAAEEKDYDTISTTYVVDGDGFETGKTYPWHPSIHMPREAARIFLQVTEVRAERLQDTSESDVKTEGIKIHIPVPGDGEPNPCLQFKQLWDSLNAKRGYGWDKNPWVWVISFELIDKPEVQHETIS